MKEKRKKTQTRNTTVMLKEKHQVEKKKIFEYCRTYYFFFLYHVFEIFPNDIIIYHCMTASHIGALPCASSISSLINSQQASFNSNKGKI